MSDARYERGHFAAICWWGQSSPRYRTLSFARIAQLQQLSTPSNAPVDLCAPSTGAFLLAPQELPPVTSSPSEGNLARCMLRDFKFHTEVASLMLKQNLDRAWRSLSGIATLPQAPQVTKRVLDEETQAAHTVNTYLLRAESLQTQGDLRGAVALLDAAHAIDPNNASVASLLSKQWTDHSYLPGVTSEQVMTVNDKAIHYALAAQAADPTFSLAHCAESICKGRKACFENGPKRKLQLAKEAQEAAYRALDINHADDVAHHLIGRWHVGMAGLNFFVKACIKYVFGTDFRPGTMEGALLCYQTAAGLRPDRLIHRVELARCYEHFGRRDDAIAELRVCLELPLEDVNARQMLEEGVKLLKKLDPTCELERTPAYIDTSAADLRTVWPEFASALDEGSAMDPLLATPVISAV